MEIASIRSEKRQVHATYSYKNGRFLDTTFDHLAYIHYTYLYTLNDGWSQLEVVWASELLTRRYEKTMNLLMLMMYVNPFGGQMLFLFAHQTDKISEYKRKILLQLPYKALTVWWRINMNPHTKVIFMIFFQHDNLHMLMLKLLLIKINSDCVLFLVKFEEILMETFLESIGSRWWYYGKISLKFN